MDGGAIRLADAIVGWWTSCWRCAGGGNRAADREWDASRRIAAVDGIAIAVLGACSPGTSGHKRSVDIPNAANETVVAGIHLELAHVFSRCLDALGGAEGSQPQAPEEAFSVPDLCLPGGRELGVHGMRRVCSASQTFDGLSRRAWRDVQFCG